MATENNQGATLQGINDADFAEAIANPSSFSVEGLSQSNRSLGEMIAADKYLRARRLVSHRRHPLAGLVSHVVNEGTYR